MMKLFKISFIHSSPIPFIIIINVISSLLIIIVTILIDNGAKFEFFEMNCDLRYIEHAIELKNKMFFEPYTNSINAPFYPLILFVFSLFFKLQYLNIMVFQWVLMTFSLVFMSVELYIKYKSFKVLLSIYVFTYFNPIFYQLNDGGVFPEFFSSIILFLLIAVWLRFLRKNSLNAMFFLTIVSGILIITRYEFIVLIGFIFIYILKSQSYKKAMLYLLIPALFILINSFKNYLIFREFRLLSFSLDETKFGGITSDGSWHYIDSLNAESHIPSKYLERFHLIHSDSNFTRRIKQKDHLFHEMYIDKWKTNYSQIIKMIPCKFMKLYIPPPSIDIYTCCPELECDLKMSNYFGFEGNIEGQNQLDVIITFVFHASLLLLTLISIYLNWSTLIFKPFIWFVVSNSFILIVLFYGLSRFNFNFYPIFIVIQGLLFCKQRT